MSNARAVRSDARRNQDAILDAAKIVFAASGVDAPGREIATKAGVGIATLYRRFPTRGGLVAAVFRREVDACAAAAAEILRADTPPLEALTRWLMLYMDFITTKQGLAAALHSGDAAYDALPAYFRANFEPALAELMNAASEAGVVRNDVAPYDLLRAIGNLSVASGDDGRAHAARMIMLLVEGMRFGAVRPR